MDRHLNSTARLTAAILLVGLVSTACGHRGTTGDDRPAASASGVVADPAATVSPTATVTPTATSTAPASASADASPSPTTSADSAPTAAPTIDPIDTDLQLLDQLLNGIGSSLSDAGTGNE